MTYQRTIRACFLAYAVQAVVNNFLPLLFMTLQRQYSVPLEQITMLITVNFAVQLTVDVLSAFFVDRIGYRAALVLAHGLSAAGLLLLPLLPELLPPFFGLLIAVICYAVGGGLLEVLVSPVTDACPSPNKETAMSLLHSFYCWGQVAVVLLSTCWFLAAGREHWKLLAVLWAVLPAVNGILFLRTPIPPVLPEGTRGMTLAELLRSGVFRLLICMMVCAGACELAVSQWASFFAEEGLHVSKTAGDLLGPMTFAVLMGSARALYSKFGTRIRLTSAIRCSALLCLISYLMIALAPSAGISLAGCALSGLAVGILWPGTFSRASAALPRGGTLLFSLLALGGDIGCAGGPTVVGAVTSLFRGNLRAGFLAASVFPAVLLVLVMVSNRKLSDRETG